MPIDESANTCIIVTTLEQDELYFVSVNMYF